VKRPLIAVTMGDPAGIGPEIVVKALQDEEVMAASRPLVIGDRGVLEQAARFCEFQGKIRVVGGPEEGAYASGTIELLDLGNVELASLKIGAVQGMCGRAAFEYIQKAAELASSGRVDAIATAPINKESLRAAQVDFIGHTEILSALTGATDPLTMFQPASWSPGSGCSPISNGAQRPCARSGWRKEPWRWPASTRTAGSTDFLEKRK
jgi:4-hydroxy-L-threonine phosphate dehydrogenase PdxA